MTTPVPAILNPAERQQTAIASRRQIASNFQDFLKLLTTQLRNQDPTAPLDTNQFTQQLVMFAQVEQQLAANQSLERLIRLQETSQLTALTPLIGRTVEAEASAVVLQDGAARGAYSLRADSTATTVTIRDRSGRIVAQLAGQTRAGRHEFTWDGRDGFGRRLPDGVYTVRVEARRGATTEPVPTTVIGRITGAERAESGLKLSIGGLTIDSSAIRSVSPDR
ncbi:MAG: flagellar hook assembly protein FlgD [Elioraea sp.]|nr:flagellar hook assembly protein FlgD [Elioraea sp.]MDW8445395.1 flagellar hook capping FlgD N-terminal domain-containing protein [Acetobacteraceae bacterium]